MTVQSAFRDWLIIALGDRGGALTKRAALDEIDQQFGSSLDAADRKHLESRPDARWRITASFERADMVRDGQLETASATGLWELSAAGWARYKELRGRGPSRLSETQLCAVVAAVLEVVDAENSPIGKPAGLDATVMASVRSRHLAGWRDHQVQEATREVRGALWLAGKDDPTLRGESSGHQPPPPELIGRVRRVVRRRSRRAWLMMASGEDRQHRGNEGYDDDPQSHYSWDSTVANHAAPDAGDIIVLWDKKRLLGASVVDAIEVREGAEKLRLRCPSCNKTTIKQRSTASPPFRCYRCHHEFVAPVEERLTVTSYRSVHEARWVSLPGRLDAAAIRDCCEHTRSIQSLRRLRWDRLWAASFDAATGDSLRLIERNWSDREKEPTGGHRPRVVRVRLGQGAFRRKLEAQYGHVCAFTGPQPSSALEAAHLYSYAEVGRHEKHGGLLLRRDVHRLFDLGLLTVEPETLRIEVNESLMAFADYAALAGQATKVQVPPKSRRWLAEHRRQYLPAE